MTQDHLLVRYFGNLKMTLAHAVILGLSAGYAFATAPGHGIDWSSFQLWTLGLSAGLGVWNPHWTGLPQNVGHFTLNFITDVALLTSGQARSFLTFAVNDRSTNIWLYPFWAIIWLILLSWLVPFWVAHFGLICAILIKPQSRRQREISFSSNLYIL